MKNSDFSSIVRDINNDITKVVADTTLEFVSSVREKSQQRVPVQTGFLKRSWYDNVNHISIDDRGSSFNISFGYSADYAGPVDDRTKFFTSAVEESLSIIGE